MAGALSHRGPDDRGTYTDPQAALAHLRLSIIDLSTLGHQPMSTPDGRLHLIFNGEIYNYRELRDDLRARVNAIQNESDSEFQILEYEECGEA